MLGFQNSKLMVFYFVMLSLLFSGCTRFSSRNIDIPHESNSGNGSDDEQSQPPPEPPTPPPEPPAPPPSGNCGTLTLLWNRNTESDLSGYRVYRGLRSGVYDTQVDIGNPTNPSNPNEVTYQFTNLAGGATHYFAVTAYDTSQNESTRSIEVSRAIPTCTTVNDTVP